MPTPIFSWHQQLWEDFMRRIVQNRVPHALLLYGQAGSGKLQFGLALAELRLCTTANSSSTASTPSPTACGECSSCKLFRAGTHSDFTLLQPEEGKSILSVDAMREMVAGAAYTPQISPRRVVVINPAESMNRNSANSLLKTLEEPPGDTNIILISHTPSMLLPTIRSRCQQIAFPPPSSAEAAQWLQEQGVSAEEVAEVLQLAEGAPLHALTLASSDQREHNKLMGEELNALQRGQANPIKVAYRWANKKNDPVLTLRWLQQRVDLLLKLPIKLSHQLLSNCFSF